MEVMMCKTGAGLTLGDYCFEKSGHKFVSESKDVSQISGQVIY